MIGSIYIRKTFFNDKGFKNKLKFQSFREECEKTLNSIDGTIDYTLLIRPDIYPIDVIEKLKEKSHKIVAYQWDGLHRFPAVYSCIHLFDRFFIFDKEDLKTKKYDVLPLTNFYFDFDINNNNNNV